MKLLDIVQLNEMTVGELKDIKVRLIKKYKDVGIDLLMSPHCMERSINGNMDNQGNDRGNRISYGDMLGCFSRIKDKFVEEFKQHPGMNGIITDTMTNINVSFKITTETGNICFVIRTIMNKANFKCGDSLHLKI